LFRVDGLWKPKFARIADRLSAPGPFGAGLAVTAALYFWTDMSRVALFWAAFILTRPLGATLGDLLDKPMDHGGLALSRPMASAVIAMAMVACIILLPQRPGRHPGRAAVAE